MPDRGAGSRQQSDFHRKIIEESTDIATVIDTDGTITYVSPAVERVLGYDPEDLVGENGFEYQPEETRTVISDAIQYVIDNPDDSRTAQTKFRRADGSWCWIETTLHNRLDDPVIDGILAMSRDVSDRKAKQAKLEGIFEAARDVSFVIAKPTSEGTDALIQEFSPGAEQLFGYDREEAIGEPIGILHRQAEIERIPEIKSLIESDESWYDEVEHVRKDGSTFPALLSVYPIDLDGQTCFLGVSIDISERKQRSRALERLHDSTRELMTATTPEEVATIGSETATRVLDRSMNGIHFYEESEQALVPVAWTEDSEELLGGSPPALAVEDSLSGRVFRTGNSEYYADVTDQSDRFAADTPFESELILPLGDHGVFILSSRTPDGFDQIDRTLAQVLAANIETALDRVEQRQQLERQNERLDEFASVLSHDLRNPLNVAKLRLDLAQSESDSEHLDAVDRAHRRIQTLIDDLLTVAREGNVIDELEPTALDSVVESCWRNVDTEEATIQAETDVTIRADRSRLQQLLENLFRNAVEHNDSDVGISVGRLDNGFYVADDGAGIPPQDRDELFDIGYSTADEGTGFGLVIVRRVAEAHGWNVSVVEGDNGGARFEITGVDTTAG